MTADSHEAARSVLRIVPLVMRAVAADLRDSPHGILPPHFPILWMLRQRSWSLGELAEKQAVSPPTMSNTVTALEARGWVQRTPSAGDRRRVQVELTAQGRDVLDNVQRRSEARMAALLDRLSAAECQTLTRGLALLEHAFMAQPSRVQPCAATGRLEQSEE